jgi:uncharacterized protein YggT (Ycf19 family)
MNIPFILARALVFVINIYTYIMLATCLLSWFVSPMSKVMQFLHALCEPIVAPFRSLSMKLSASMNLPIDLSFLFAYFALQILSSLLMRLMWILA